MQVFPSTHDYCKLIDTKEIRLRQILSVMDTQRLSAPDSFENPHMREHQ
jgi:hypothetical protein